MWGTSYAEDVTVKIVQLQRLAVYKYFTIDSHIWKSEGSDRHKLSSVDVQFKDLV